MIKIPLHNLAHFSERVALNAQEYKLEFVWVDRAKYFMLNLYDHEEQPMILGARLQKDWPLLRRVNDFKGDDFILIGQGEPGPDNLDAFELVHVL